MSEWMHVNDSLPDLDKPVIVCYLSYDGKQIYAWGARCDDAEGWLWGIGGHYGVHPKEDAAHSNIEADDEYKVTHWMPLPELPQQR